MKPNPHDLINLPGAGNAEKALRKAGMWRLTPMEMIEKATDNLRGYVDDIQSAADDCEYAMRDLEKAMEAK